MPKRYALVLTALCVPLIISCERAAQPARNAAQVSPQPASAQPGTSQSSATVGSEEPSDTVIVIPNDSLVVTDTTGTDFGREDLTAVKTVLEARLHSEEFTASGPSPQYGNPCRFYDTTSVRRYTSADVRFAFVRPRVIKIAYAGDDHYVRRVNADAEITRVALLQRGVDAKWHGSVNVTRDTVSLVVSSSVKDSTWTVCEKPAHLTGWNTDGSLKPYTPWLPVRSSDVERMAVVWDERVTTEKLRQLADSISKLPSTFLVEGNPEPKVPMVYKDICQYEGCSFGEWLTCDTTRIFAEPGTTARTAFMLKRGDRFTAVTGEMHVMQAGMVVFRRNVKIEAEGWTYYFTPADTLYPLMYGSEGGGLWYFRGKEAGGDFFFGNGDPDDIGMYAERGYDLVRPINSQWWVKVRAKDGREGWFVPGANIYGRQPHYETMPEKCPTNGAE
ncbi:MAG: hypothetical protein ACJ8AK_15895 [Gemmatimonadaceae bacterium]